LDGVHEIVREQRDEYRGDAKPEDAPPEAKHSSLLLILVVIVVLLLLIQVRVGDELEVQERDVDHEKDGGGEARQRQLRVGAAEQGLTLGSH
jgi:hypothetical protein